MRDLPSGTVTLLFSDIEGSSRRWEQDQNLMREALTAHDKISVDAVEKNGGLVFKHTGDGIAAAFSAASAAAEAAVAIQAGLQAHHWQDGEALKVRIGLHSGDAEPTEGDYFGPAPNRTARVMDVANGDQIACSSAAAGLLSGLDLRSRGNHELRGIGVEEVFLLSDPRFVSSELPFRQSVEPSNLPRIFTSFLGRDDEIDSIKNLLSSESGLVTLVGPGGVGKTRLAIEVATSLKDRHADGVYYCELASVSDPSAVADSVADVIGARRQPGMSLIESIVDYVAGQRMLILLDNAEHVVEAVRDLVEPLHALPDTVVLVTGREGLALPGERVVLVTPLDVSTTGVSLFEERARERDPQFAVDETNRDAVEEIVRSLDGIPLAIELAAAWTRVMSAPEILSRLSDRFRLLRGGRQGDRHQTLLETVNWSYDLLSESEAALFSRLCVFAGGFSLEAAEAVCSDTTLIAEQDVADTLMALVDKSMLVTNTGGISVRFAMLETLRQFGEDVLAASETEGTYRRRHADHYLHVAAEQADRVFTRAESDAWRVLDREWDNLRVALESYKRHDDLASAGELVLHLAWFAAYSLRFELFTWAEELLVLPGANQDSHYTSLCGAAALGAYFTVDEASVGLAEQGLAHDPSDPLGLCRTALAAVYLNNTHTPEDSERLTTEWLASKPQGISNRMWADGFRVFHLCTYAPSAEAAELVNEVARIAHESGSPTALALAAWAEGQVVAVTDREAAIAIWQKGLEWPRSLPGHHLIESLLTGLILHFEARRGDLSTILAESRAALKWAAQEHYLAGASHLFGVTAIGLTRAGRPEMGAKLLGAMVANGHRPRMNALRVLQAALGDDLEANMDEGRVLTVKDASTLAMEQLSECLEELTMASDADV